MTLHTDGRASPDRARYVNDETWRGKIPTPPHAHPLVRKFIVEANAQRKTLKEIGDRSGVSWQAISNWRYRSCPTLDNFEAALNVLDLELVIRHRRNGD